MMTRYIPFIILTALLSATAACNDIEVDHVRIEEVGFQTADTQVNSRFIQLPVGVAVEIRAAIIFEGDYYYYGDYYHLESADDYILGVAPMEDSDNYLIWGESVGRTCLEVNVAGTVETCIDVEITEQDEDTDAQGDTAAFR